MIGPPPTAYCPSAICRLGTVMKHLPIELVGVVAENIASTSDLLAFRSVNSACHHLVTPHVFRTLHIHNSVNSTQNFGSILATPSLASHVRQVVYDQRDYAQFCLLPAGAEGDCISSAYHLAKQLTSNTGSCDELEIADLEDALTEAFCSLPGFKNLESVVLNFWPSFRSQCGTEIQEHPFWFTNRQITVLHAVHHALKTSRLRSLAVKNVILMAPGCYDFVSSVANSPLQHFSMSVVANSELGDWSGSKSINGSLSPLLPLSNANLKSLELRSPQGLYHSYNTQLRSSYYPALETLVLENIVFDPTPSADGIEDFIVRHKGSLRRLEFRSCSSYVTNVATPVRRWSTIWGRLAAELDNLTEIVVDNVQQSYALLDGIHGFIPQPPPLETTQEDEELLLQFRDRVHLRSSFL